MSAARCQTERIAERDRFEAGQGVAEALSRLIAAGELNLPMPGSGHTWARFEGLAEIAAHDLSLARWAEGHADALAILAEAGVAPHPGARYGVWAAEKADARVTAVRVAGGWRLDGGKRFASGAGSLERALVTARAADGDRLFDVDACGPRVSVNREVWRAVGMAATDSGDITFEGPFVPEHDTVGPPGFYLARPGFWYGAIGVAACWYGGALGCLRMLRGHLQCAGMDAHQAAHLGAVTAACHTMRSVLRGAADRIDDGARSPSPLGETDALLVRHIVETACQDVLHRTGRAGGTSPLVFDRLHAHRAADLVVYLRQHHAERDLEVLGRRALGGDE